MRNNLLKQLTMALLIAVAMPCAKAQMAHVGDILCEGDLIVSPANYNANTHTAIGVVFYVDNTGQHGWAIALEDAGKFAWGGFNSDTQLVNYGNGRQAIYDLDGYENTRIVREHSTDHPAFYAVDFANGWYVPTIGQLNYLYGNLIEVNASLQAVGGGKFETGSDWNYWSSTENSSYFSWYFTSSGEIKVGYMEHYYYWSYYESKNVERHVRAVRNF